MTHMSIVHYICISGNMREANRVLEFDTALPSDIFYDQTVDWCMSSHQEAAFLMCRKSLPNSKYVEIDKVPRNE